LEHHRQPAFLGAYVDAAFRRIDRDAVDPNFARGRLLKEVPLHNGTMTTRLTGLSSGAWTFRVVFPTTPTVTRGIVERRITIL
jgi:hypothetical protein